MTVVLCVVMPRISSIYFLFLFLVLHLVFKFISSKVKSNFEQLKLLLEKD